MEIIQVMEPVLAKDILTGNEWIHQVKWDGIRGITYIEDGGYKVLTKSGRERTDFYPELKDAITLLNGKQAVLDGEIIVFDSDNKPSFQRILTRERLRTKENLPAYLQKYPVNYIIFDILFINGRDLRNLTLEERSEILHSNMQKSAHITLTDSFKDGAQLFDLMRQKNYEGIVSKHKSSRYLAGKKHNQWYKTKILKKTLAVIGGLSWRAGMPNSLLLGIYENNSLVYIGNASLGLSQNDLRLLKDYSSSRSQDRSPFIGLSKAKDTTWLPPVLTCWVSYLEWTDGKNLRHPKILGFSNEEAINAVGKEFSV